jgi:hypothetical protein
MLRTSRLCLKIEWNKSQVLGAAVPTYQRYPYRGRDILRLYRNFWRLVQRLPLSEQRDAAFKLRNAFRSKRHFHHEKSIAKAYQQGLGQYEAMKGKLDETAQRSDGAFAVRRKQRAGGASKQQELHVKAVTVDGVWAALKNYGDGVVPNLRNIPQSKRVEVTAPRSSIEVRIAGGGNFHSS